MDTLVAYKEKLLPILKRSQIMDDLDSMRNDYQRLLLPELERTSPFINRVKDQRLSKMLDSLVRVAKLPRGDGVFNSLAKSLQYVPKNLDKIQEIVKTDFPGEQISTDALTFRQVALLRYVEISQFVFEYTMRFIRAAYAVELETQGVKDNDTITKNEKQALDDNFISYANAITVLAVDPSKIEKTIRETPAINIDSATTDVLSFTVGGKADPTKSGFISLNWNPIYRLRIFIAGFQAKKYRRAKEQLRMFEIQRLRLENIKQGKIDPLLDKQAQELTGIINELQADILDMEKSYA